MPGFFPYRYYTMNARNQNPQSVLELTRHKTACEYCGKHRAVDRALKQCKGCTVTWYCSKRCQVAAWPHHKKICTSRSGAQVPPLHRNLGRATMAEVSHASKEWAEVHKLTLFMMATVLVELRAGGAHAVLDAPQSIVFDLGPPRADAYDGSPSTAFTLARVDIGHQASLGGVTADQWSPPVVALRRVLARSFRTANAHPDIVGVLPATFYIQDAQLAAQSNLPLHRRRPRIRASAGGAALDERTKKALYSLLGVCLGVINTGTVFRIPEDANQVVPDIGQLERRGKGWKWAPAVASSQTGNIAVEFFGSPEFEGAPIPPLDSFAIYHRLWPYRSLRIDSSRSS